MDTYVAKRDCYWDGLFLKKGETIQVPKGKVIEFNLLEKVTEDEPTPKKVVSKK